MSYIKTIKIHYVLVYALTEEVKEKIRSCVEKILPDENDLEFLRDEIVFGFRDYDVMLEQTKKIAYLMNGNPYTFNENDITEYDGYYSLIVWS